MTHAQLYFSLQPTRSARARWAFLEAGIDFQPHVIDVFKGDQRGDEYLKVHPLGVVPAATFDGTSVTESSAIALIVATQQPQAKLLPEQGSAAWRAALQWVVFAPAEMDHRLATITQHTRFLPPAERNADLVAAAAASLKQRVKVVADSLGDKPFLLGKQLSVADVCVGHAVFWAYMVEQLDEFPTLVAYLKRLQERAAFLEVYGPELRVFPDPHAS